MIGSGTIAELVLIDGSSAARIRCAPGLIPAPGQYVLAHQPGSDSPLAGVLFRVGLTIDGFIASPPSPPQWTPGIKLDLRGPLGHGFVVPAAAARIALVAFDDGPRRLLSLMDAALRQDVSIALVSENPPDDLPFQIEVQPPSALQDVLKWADYAAFDVARESLPGLGRKLHTRLHRPEWPRAQVLVRVPMPCGALAECGVCAVRLRRGIGLACDAGPVFELELLDLES